MSQSHPRIFLTGLFHETHTFLAGPTPLSACAISNGAQVGAISDSTSPLGAALATGRELGWEFVPSWDVRTSPSATIADEVVEFWWKGVQQDLREALAQGLDGIFIVFHGAMASQSYPDVEGEVLKRMRGIVGPDIPIFGPTDLHLGFTDEMARYSNGLVTYRNNPHTDAAETSVRAALLLDSVLKSGKKAATVWQPTNIIWPPTGTGTADEPMRSLEELARQIEDENPEILAVNVHGGYAFADIYNCGVSFSAVTVGDPGTAKEHLARLRDKAWENRAQGNVLEKPFEELWPALQAVLANGEKGPVVLTEPSDNIGGGAPGDGTGLLRDLIEHNVADSVVVINDAAAVEELQSTPLGAQRELTLGGSSLGYPGAGPIQLRVTLQSRSDGNYTLEDKNSHLASMVGQHIKMGNCAVVVHQLASGGRITILLTTVKSAPFDLGQLRSQGIEPGDYAVIGVKAAVAHRRAYDKVARASFAVATPGPCTSNLKLLPYRNVRRPVYPLDDF